MKRVVVALCFCLLIVASAGCRGSHDTETFYAARADAEKNGEFDRGWLPDFLPKSSHAIHLAYDLSPSQVWCAFEFDVADAGSLLNSVNAVDRLAPPLAEVPSPHLKWWPKSLQGHLNVEVIREAGLALYSETHPVSQAENETLLFAVDQTHGRGYFYGH